jgi:hypothetical protein
MSNIKGEVLPGAAPRSKFRVFVGGLPPFYASKFTGLESELETVELADRTMQSAGNTKASTADVSGYVHHSVEAAAWDAWWVQSQAGGAGYKRAATVEVMGADDIPVAIYALAGVFPMKWSLGDLDKTSTEATEITYSLSVDSVIKTF